MTPQYVLTQTLDLPTRCGALADLLAFLEEAFRDREGSIELPMCAGNGLADLLYSIGQELRGMQLGVTSTCPCRQHKETAP